MSSLDLSFVIFVLSLEPSWLCMCVYLCVSECTYRSVFKTTCPCVREALLTLCESLETSLVLALHGNNSFVSLNEQILCLPLYTA